MKNEYSHIRRRKRFIKFIFSMLAVPLIGVAVLQFAISFPVIEGYVKAYQIRLWQLPADTHALSVTAEHGCGGNSCFVWGHLVVESATDCIDLWDYLDVKNPDDTIFVYPKNGVCVVTLQIEVD